MSKKNYNRYNGNREKKQICLNLYKRQVIMIDEFVMNEIYDNRSDLMRLALDFFLSHEYIQALKNKRKKIIKTIKKNGM